MMERCCRHRSERTTVVLPGPITTPSTMIRSRSITKCVSCLVIEDHLGSQGWHLDATSEEMADQRIRLPPHLGLIEWLLASLAMANDTCGLDLHAVERLVLDLDEADPLVGIQATDLGPGQGLRDRRRDLLGGAHPTHPRRCGVGVKFLAIVVGRAVTRRRASDQP